MFLLTYWYVRRALMISFPASRRNPLYIRSSYSL